MKKLKNNFLGKFGESQRLNIGFTELVFFKKKRERLKSALICRDLHPRKITNGSKITNQQNY